MTEVNCTVRTMKKEDVPMAVDVWRETGMHGGMHSLYTWLTVDPEAFSIAVTDEGEVIGVCCACIHHEDLATVGYYAVKEKYIGHGVGLKVWNACMDHIGSRNACINSAPSKFEIYRDKGGFPIVELDWVSFVNKTPNTVHSENLSDIPPSDVDIQPFDDCYLPIMFEYDRKLIGYNRELAIKLNCNEQDSRTFVSIKGGICAGYGTIKLSYQKCGQVGPLYADDKEVAEVMLKKLILSLPEAKGFVMMTINNHGPTNELLKKIGCPTIRECPRLYRKSKVDVDFSKVFALFDLSFSLY